MVIHTLIDPGQVPNGTQLGNKGFAVASAPASVLQTLHLFGEPETTA